jgi:hypothetical protein
VLANSAKLIVVVVASVEFVVGALVVEAASGLCVVVETVSEAKSTLSPVELQLISANANKVDEITRID